MRSIFYGLTCAALLGGGQAFAGKPTSGYPHHDSRYFLYEPPKKTFAPFDDHVKSTIPSHRPVPPGWVVVGTRHSGIYSGRNCVMLVIEKLHNQVGMEMNMSAMQPLPEGWVVVDSFYSIHNPKKRKNTVRIRKVY